MTSFNFSKKLFALSAISLVFSNFAQADDMFDLTPTSSSFGETNTSWTDSLKLWNADFDFGFNKSTGSTSSSGLFGGAMFDRKGLNWDNIIRLKYRSESENGSSSKKQFDAGYKAKKKLSEKDYVYGDANYNYDKFGPYTKSYDAVVGYGYKVIDENKMKLNVEAGIGYRNEKEATKDWSDDIILKPGIDFEWLPRSGVKFNQYLNATIGSNNTKFDSISVLKVMITDKMHVKGAFDLTHNTKAPKGHTSTDTTTTISIGYSW